MWFELIIHDLLYESVITLDLLKLNFVCLNMTSSSERRPGSSGNKSNFIKVIGQTTHKNENWLVVLCQVTSC